MADKIYVGRKTKSFYTSPRFPEYDMVVINIDDNQYVSSPRASVNKGTWISAGLGNGSFDFVYNNGWKRNGTSVSLATYGLSVTYPEVTSVKNGDVITVEQTTETKDDETVVTVTASMSRSGRCLETDNPFGTVQIADDLLAKVYGLSYQPYSAGGAILDPSAELGDAITAYGIYGGLYAQDLTFGRLMASDISAAGEEEIDNEYQYKTADQRKYARKFADIQSEFTIQASQIAAKVEQIGGNQNFSWELESDHFVVMASGNPMLYIDKNGSQFAGVVKANSIQAGNIMIGGQPVYAGYIEGGNGTGGGVIAGGTITGGNIGSNTVAVGNTSFAQGFANDIDDLDVRVSNLESTWGTFQGVEATTWFTFQGHDVRWSTVNGVWVLARDNS